jgi:hypothetical protein
MAPAAAAKNIPQQQQPQAPSRMTLTNVSKGKVKKPTRVVLYGPEGVGKSTFGANAPKPIFLGSEDGTDQLDVQRFPTPETWEDVFAALRVLATEPHDYETLVVDSLDWLEPLLWEHVCKRDGEANIEAYGYGKGYQVALDEWRRMLAGLEQLRKAKPMHVVLLAHSVIKPFKNPTGDDFDRYELKIQAKAAGLIKEWSDAVLFANWETFAKKDSKTERVKGVSTGARLIYTERRAAFDAKNRYSLPDEMPLAWEDFAAAVDAGHVAEPSALRAEITRKAQLLGGEVEIKILELLAKAGDNAESLALINNKANAKLAEKGQ